MSTDTYIDVHLIEFPQIRDNEYYNDRSYSSLRIGYISQLNNHCYDIYTELQNLNFVFPMLSETVISFIESKYKMFLQAVKIINSTKDDNLKDNLGNYGYNIYHSDNPINDIVRIQNLLSFLTKNKDKYWQIRVD
jgi:hypothetical protein